MEAFVTLVATDLYASGALVIAHRLRELGSKKDLVCLVTPNISAQVQSILSKLYKIVLVDTMRSRDMANLQLLGRPDLDITFTKIHAWRLSQYRKIVFLDADTFPFQNLDALFDRPSFSAAPDAGWPDCFNSGVFVTEPSESVYCDLVELASQQGSFDGGDQGLLNTYFSSWPDSPSHRLPFTFNTTPTAQYGYAPAQVQYGHTINLVHFIGQNKPWKYQRFADGKVLPMGDSWEGTQDMIQAWWDTWDKYYGRISPYHLFSGYFTFDDEFQTRPIMRFHETIQNAWENEKFDITDTRRHVNPMPPLSTITVTQPDWLQEVLIAEHEHEHKKEVEHVARQSVEQQEPYPMIHWDPAYQNPPNTGSLGADIPDLSSYTNVWDQSLQDQQQHIWVAPVFRPEPEIMKKPEYAQYRQEEERHEEYYREEHRPEETYKEESNQAEHKQDEHRQEEFHQAEYHQEGSHQAEHHQEEHHQVEQHQKEVYQEHHNQDEHIHEEHHQREYYQEESHQIEHVQEQQHKSESQTQEEQHTGHLRNDEENCQESREETYPIAFPWEANPEHFPTPTRVWQDENYRFVESREEETNHAGSIEESVYVDAYEHSGKMHEDQKVHTETYEHVEKVQEETYNQDCKHIDGKEEIHDQNYDYVDNQEHDNAILTSNDAHIIHGKVQEAATNKHFQSNYTNLQEENLKVTEQVEETIKVVEEDEKIIDVDCHQEIIEEKDNLMTEDKTTNTAAAFAIDEALSPSVQTRIGELIADLHKDENDDDVSDRDLIPINFKPSSKLQSGMYTPSPLGSRSASRVGSRSGSRRSSIVSSRRNSLSGNQKRTLTDTALSTSILVETREQPSSLFATDKISVFSRKTPYTSAAVTPAVVLTPEFETSSYFHNEEILTEQDDFLQPSAYCLSESLEMAHQTKSPAVETWNPLDALTKLKSQSESMVLKQSLTEALNRAVKEQEELDNLEQLESAVKIPRKKKSMAFKSVWNNEEEEEELPSALLSGQSSPRTPVIRGMTSNLSNEIEQEKERYRQQRESLLLAQPQNAVASLLEAELDLSRGTLFKRRHYETQSEIPYETQDTPFPLTHSKEEDEEEESLHTAYYSEDVIKEAQKRLSMLTSSQKLDDISNNEPLPLPTDTFIPSNKPIVRPSHMYQQGGSMPSFSSSFDSKKYYPNFGFDEQHKLKIYQSDLIEPEIIASMKSANVLQVKEGSLSKSTEKTLEENDEQKISIEVEQQVTVNPCENESTEENMVVEYQEWPKIESVEKDDLEKKSTKEIGKQDCSLVEDESVEKLEGNEKEKATSEIVIETHEQTPTKEVVEVEIIDKQEENLTDKATEKECLMPSDEDWITVANETLITKESENDLAESSLKEEVLTISEEDLVTIKKRELLKEEKEQAPMKDESFPSTTKKNTEQTCVIGELVVTGETQDVQSIIDSINVHKEKEEHSATKSKEALEEEIFEHHITAKATDLSITKQTDVDILRIREKDEIQFKGTQPSEISKQLVEGTIIINEDRTEEQIEEEKPQEHIEIQKETAKEIETDQSVEIYEVEEEEFDDAKIGRYEIEGLVVESDSQESISESLIETVEAETVEHEYRTETLEFEEDEEILEVEEIDSGSHITTLELEDEDLEIESMDDEFQVEIMELEEEDVSSDEIVQESNVETIEIKNEVLVTEISSREADTEIIEIETDVVEPEKRSQEINVETTMITMEPMEIEYGSPNAEATSNEINVETIETNALKIETINREVDAKMLETKAFPKRMSESVTSEIIGSSSFYTASSSLPSSTESLRRSATMPARKLSIAESLLSFSRPTVTSIVTTPVIVEAFERNSDSSSLREDIVSRVRTYARSRTISTASIESVSASSRSASNARPFNSDSKNTPSP